MNRSSEDTEFTCAYCRQSLHREESARSTNPKTNSLVFQETAMKLLEPAIEAFNVEFYGHGGDGSGSTVFWPGCAVASTILITIDGL